MANPPNSQLGQYQRYTLTRPYDYSYTEYHTVILGDTARRSSFPMSFTEDELQAFNTILERRLSAHRRDMERTFDQRLNALRRELDQRLATAQQEMVRTVTRHLSDQQHGLNTTLNQKLSTQRTHVTEAISRETERNQHYIEELMDRVLAAQLLGIEQLISQRLQAFDEAGTHTGADDRAFHPHIEAIEVQTDLPWEDLMEVFGKVLDARFAALDESIQATMKRWEQYLLAHLHSLREQAQPYSGDVATATSTQELIRGIEHLERIIESMQVVMTTNHALLSNRLYHHQQLPRERAHPADHASSVNGISDPRSLPGEHGSEEH